MIISLIQMNSGLDKAANLASALTWASIACKQKAKFILLPEVFLIRAYQKPLYELAEPIPGPSTDVLCQFCKENKVNILAGSMYERKDTAIYNSSVLINTDGRIDAIYRKIHLFDVKLENKTIQESRYLSHGSNPTLATLNTLCLGLSICYDLRFPELYRAYSKLGANILCVPSAFMHHTGKAHWHTLLRARAIENQCFVLAPNQVGSSERGPLCYGHSLIIDPWGTILAEGNATKECLVTAKINLTTLKNQRKKMPVLTHRKL